jgi:hypothetical protein
MLLASLLRGVRAPIIVSAVDLPHCGVGELKNSRGLVCQASKLCQ